MTRHGALAAFVALFLILAQVATAAAAPASQGGGGQRGTPAAIDKGLQQELKAGTATKILVEFDARANLSSAKKFKERTKRGTAVLKALTDTATNSQKAAKATVAKTKGVKATTYWLTNVLVVEGDAKTLDKVARQLAKLKGVTTIRAPKVYPLVKPVETKVAILAAAGDPEWGVEKIRADQAWVDGVLGQGIVVSNVDTGVDFEHPALVEQYRGNDHDGTFTHDYNWWDPSGSCPGEPCDNVFHGTHTMGTMVGGDGPGPFSPDTGVAPGAQWIAAKGCEDFGCSETSLLSSGQFILAPTDLNGDNPDPSRRPDIVNNSWGGGPGDTFYLETVQAWRAAGIIPVFSSGNPGPFCGEGGSPGDFLESFSAGATDEQDDIAEFSGRGPSTFGKINPDVAAPGVEVVSSVPGGGYEAFSGTSMAAPHVAGTLALMMSSEPALRGDFDAATFAIRATAIDHLDDSCGGDEDGDPNNVYGDGRIDAKAAVDLVATGGTLAGTVREANAAGTPIAGARVTANDGSRDFTAVTDTNGDYDLFLAAGTYLVTVSAFGYFGDFASGVVIVTDETTDQDFSLVLLPRFTVSGTVSASEDGSPIAGAHVRALNTPVPAAVTNASGDYSLELPIGTYTLRATSNGCTESAEAEITGTVEDQVVDQDFSLFRKLDDFGHACAAIPFDWVTATGQSALYGHEFAGRLHLPFEFPFYDETYEQIFLSDNGYMNFLAPEQYYNFPSAIPNGNPPNAAIYGLWQDLYLDAGSSIDYELIGTEPDRAFVIAYSNVRAFGASGAISFEVKLWENGTIDLLYGANAPNPGDGRNATVGIENAAGDDALQLGFMDPVLAPNSAVRITTVPTGLVSGVVTDANDGLPIAGATVTAQPGGREATTDETGAYSLRLLPGNYTLTASKDPYDSASSPVTIVDGSDLTRDFALNAAIGSVDPTEITATVDYGETTTVPVTISNSGTADLTWEARERLLGFTGPELPPAVSVTRNHAWGPLKNTAGVPRIIIDDTVPSPVLSPIISDPAGDSTGSVDVISVRAGSDGQVLAGMALDFTADTPMSDPVGYVFLDTDQDPSTGVPAEAFSGLPTQDVGMEYFVDLFFIHDPDPIVFIVNVETFDAVAVPATIDGQSVLFDIPLDAIGGDDGNINTAMVLGDFFQPMDWAPDEGHGTIEPFSDVAWIVEDPETGTVVPGGSQVMQVTLGGAGLVPGNYQAMIVLITNDPHAQQIPISVDLTVTMPEEFGVINGTVTEAHSGEPLAGVTVSVASQWPAGTPLVLTATTAEDGTYSLVGPEGTWPAAYSLDGYLTANRDVTIVRGVTTGGVDAALHRIQPHAVLEGEVPVFILTPDRTASVTLQLGNPGGHEDLEVEIGEVDLGGPESGAAVAASTTKVKLPAGADPNARTTRAFGAAAKGLAVPPRIKAEGDVLASWNAGMALPWGVAYDGGVWLSDPIDIIDVHFSTEGVRGDEFGVGPLGEWGGDMAFDTARNLIWQVAVGGDNGIYGLDPADGSVEQVITGSPWDNISQRGLAYDQDSDVFYIGGWNEGIVYKVAGPSWPTPGETLNQCSPPDYAISGLAWNRSFGMLWQATNSESDSIFLLDPVTCEASVALPHPDGGDFGGAGLEIDVVGNLWTVGQNSGNAYLIESGLPTFSDVPWLSVSPTEATIEPDGSIDIDITVDSTGLEPGVYRALVVILTNDPDNSLFQLPVTLVVPTFQQGVDAGGGATTAVNGDQYGADRGYGTGPYGYVGASSNKNTTAAIDGTEDDGLYQDARVGMTSYRFDVPDGVYKVDLRFAEIANIKADGRKFDVSIEGDVVLPGFDVFAAAGGQDIALDRTFIVSVSDGHLDVGFTPQRGDKPIINAILVTGLPEGAPGT